MFYGNINSLRLPGFERMTFVNRSSRRPALGARGPQKHWSFIGDSRPDDVPWAPALHSMLKAREAFPTGFSLRMCAASVASPLIERLRGTHRRHQPLLAQGRRGPVTCSIMSVRYCEGSWVHRFPAVVISQAVRWYFRFQLSLRDIEELLLERGVVVRLRDNQALVRQVRRFANRQGRAPQAGLDLASGRNVRDAAR